MFGRVGVTNTDAAQNTLEVMLNIPLSVNQPPNVSWSAQAPRNTEYMHPEGGGAGSRARLRLSARH